MKVPNTIPESSRSFLSLSRLQNEGSQRMEAREVAARKSIKATE